jgi:hypothetical protein
MVSFLPLFSNGCLEASTCLGAFLCCSSLRK